MMMRFDQFRQHRQEQEKLAHTPGLPRLDDLEIVERMLPLASVAYVPSEDEIDGMQDRESVMQRRSDAYQIIRYGSLLEEDLAEKSVDLTNVSTQRELAKSVNEFWMSCEKDRSLFRNGLEHIAQNRQMAKEKLESYVSSAAKEFLIVPNLSWPTSRAVELSYIPLSDKSVLGYVLMVLLENDEVYDRLRKCRYRKCGDFFITDGSAQGGPKFSYCSDKHRKLERRKQNAESQKTFRYEEKQRRNGKTPTRQKRKRRKK